MEWDRITYEIEKHWLGFHSVTIRQLDDDNFVVCFHHHNIHFLSNGGFYIILNNDEVIYMQAILEHLTEDLPINYGGSEHFFWEDYLMCKLTIYKKDVVKETGNQYVVEALDTYFNEIITKREELLSHIEEGFVRCIRFREASIEYDAICRRYLFISFKDDGNNIIVISKGEIDTILKTLYADFILPNENDSKWVCDINKDFSIYCNSASYEKLLLLLNDMSKRTQGNICGIAEINRKLKASIVPIVVLLNKKTNDIQFLSTQGYVYRIRLTEEWDQGNGLNIISHALEKGTYSLVKKWNPKWVNYLKYHLESVLKWDDYTKLYDFTQTFRVFYNSNGNLMQVGLYEIISDRKKFPLQKIPNDKHCLGVIMGMQENHLLLWA